MTEAKIKEAIATFLAKGGKIQTLPAEVDRSSKRIVRFGYSSTLLGNTYSYDSTVYANPVEEKEEKK